MIVCKKCNTEIKDHRCPNCRKYVTHKDIKIASQGLKRK